MALKLPTQIPSKTSLVLDHFECMVDRHILVVWSAQGLDTETEQVPQMYHFWIPNKAYWQQICALLFELES